MYKAAHKTSSFTIIMVFVLLMLVGLAVSPLLNIRLNPSRTTPSTQVSFYWPEASARVVEQQVTAPIEGVLSQLTGLKNITSVSRNGSGTITLEFKKGTNLDATRFEMAMLIRQAAKQLPEAVSYPSISLSTAGDQSEPVMSYAINGNASPQIIQDYVEKNFVPRLASIDGVNTVEVYGGTPFEWIITFDELKAGTLKLSIDQLTEVLQAYFANEYLGMARISSLEQNAQVQLQLYNGDTVNWSAIPVAIINDRIIYLGQIAKVSYQEKKPTAYYRINGRNTINMVLYAGKGVNNLRLSNNIQKEMQHLKNQLPVGYSIHMAYDEAEFIRKELNKILLRTIFSLSILLLFVLIISKKFNYLLLILASIIANLCIAAFFYFILDIEIHLYSLAGITVSFGMMIDNSIIMIDHIRNRGNHKVFLAILAATLTTIGALSVVIFLKAEQRINLIDFSLVMIINLAISIFIALFLIPALFEKIPVSKNHIGKSYRYSNRMGQINLIYRRFILFTKRWRLAFFAAILLAFGIPVHWLPEKIESENVYAKTYNKTWGNEWVQKNIKPYAEKTLGGSLRLFSEFVYNGSFYAQPERTRLYLNGRMPEGCTIEQLNDAIKQMEQYINQFSEVELYQTNINSPQQSNITIFFKEAYEFSSFPFYLKELLTTKAISLGGMDWNIYGVGRGFSNALTSDFKSNKILISGYNYDQLYKLAEKLQQKLETNPRVRGLIITGSSGWSFKSLNEFFIRFNHERMAHHNFDVVNLYQVLKQKLTTHTLHSVFINGEMQALRLKSSGYDETNLWSLNNEPIESAHQLFKFSQFGNIEKRQTGNDIYKNNQEYRLYLAFDFIGPALLAKKVIDKEVLEFEPELPLGYKVKNDEMGGWSVIEKNQYYLLALVILIIYFICAILLESLLQPLAIIGLIPISFIGLFFTFYLFNFNFDQGGFAAFILLSGLVVNAGLYIVNDFNNMRIQNNRTALDCYLRAFSYKIFPIFLTIFSTMLGLVPFVMAGRNEVFWFSFAVGAIGGLLFSLIAIVVYLPVMLRLRVTATR